MEGILSYTGKKWLLQHGQCCNPSTFAQQLFQERSLCSLETSLEFPDMQRACQRVHDAMEAQETITIFGDYDCDGITGCAQLKRYFDRHNYPVDVRLPHRVRDGYGLSKAIVDECIEKSVTLLITVDTGIASAQEIAYAAEHGIETIITDHHIAPAITPKAYAILHPAFASHAPLPHPSGAGVAYVFVEALEQGTWEGKDDDMVLAMIGTVADVVELTGVNRAIVQNGIDKLAMLTNGPLAQLRDATGAKTSTDIAFRVAPRINAAGRIADPAIALDALLHGGDLDALNSERQECTKEHLDAVLKTINTSEPLLWHVGDIPHGIIGLIAGRLTEQFGKPSCIATRHNGMCTASLRSPTCYNVTEGLHACHEHLTSFGGHAQAAGCSFEMTDTNLFHEALRMHVATHTTTEDLVPTLKIDSIIDCNDISLDFCKSLLELEPFGQGNPEPRFLVRNVSIDHARTVGADHDHLQCSIGTMKCIGFRLGHLMQHTNEPLDVVCRLGIDNWGGVEKVQMVIEDMSVAKSLQRSPLSH